MHNLSLRLPEVADSHDDGDDDSWKKSIRMLYLIIIDVQEPGELGGIRSYSFHVANFHNAEAIRQSFIGVFGVDVSVEPDVRAYLALGNPQDY